MKNILLGAVIITGALVGAPAVFAQETLPVIEPVYSEVLPTESLDVLPMTALEEEIQALRIKEKESNFLTRFLIRLKIQELENKLNIKKALQ